MATNTSMAANFHGVDSRRQYRTGKWLERHEKRLKAALGKRWERKQLRIAKRSGLRTGRQTGRRSIHHGGKLRPLNLRHMQNKNKSAGNNIAHMKGNHTSGLLPNQVFVPTLPLPSMDATSSFLLPGTMEGPVASIKITPDNEPVAVRKLRITLASETSSVQSFKVFDEFGYVLGSATLDLSESANHDVFTLALSAEKSYFIGKDDSISIAAKPRLKSRDNGGVGGQTILVSDMDVTAIGTWTNAVAAVTKSGQDFQKHQTALAAITAVENAGKNNGTFSVGTNKIIAEFKFSSRTADAREANPSLKSLTFSVNSPSTVELNSISLHTKESSSSSPCVYSRPQITCSNIPSEIGSLQNPQTIQLHADIALSGTHPNTYLQIEINRPGNPDSAGDISWTDGETNFDWVDFDSPVVRGTVWE